jgi:arylsulfatase A-like enzyme
MNRLHIQSAVGLSVALAILPACPAGESASKPNVILCLADDMGWGDPGYNGNPVIMTPSLDRMAREGLRLDFFYAASARCSPTRASILTGRSPQRTGVPGANRGFLREREITLAEALGAHGYATGFFGKWHLGALTKELADGRRGGPDTDAYSPPWAHGFDDCFATETAVPTWDPMDQEARREAWELRRIAKGRPSDLAPHQTRYWADEGRVVTDNLEGDDSRVIVDRVVSFVEKNAAQDRPFLAVVWFHTPHPPVVAGPEYRNRYRDLGEEMADYAGAITAMDEQIGRLRTTLDELGIADDTMLWFTSDNGPQTGSAGPYRGGKGELLEGGIRVPGLLVWPDRIDRPRAVRMDCLTDDMYPTILDAAGIVVDAQPPLDGISLLPMIESGMERRPRAMAFELGKQLAYIERPYKIYSRDRGDTFALYDIDEDIREEKDLSGSKPEILRAMQEGLEEWRSSWAATTSADESPGGADL